MKFFALLAGMLLTLCAGCSGNPPAPSEPAQAATKPPAKKWFQANPNEDVSEPDPDSDSGEPDQTDPEPAKSPVEVQTVYRPSDDRPKFDAAKLARLGIRKYSSKRLILYTDVPAAKAELLPPLMDEAYDAWVQYFGPLPPARERTEFQMTGCIMADQALFRETGLLPPDLRPFVHGRHRGQEFWMNDQKEDYYRAHLMVHEGTHCFMTIVPNPLRAAPWYIEGMAELFGTHLRQPGGKTLFRVMPKDPENFSGLGRIRMIHDDVAQGKAEALPSVLGYKSEEFLKNEMYAWSWGLCKFLDSHPRYRERLRELPQHIRSGHELEDFHGVFAADWDDLQDEWLLFSAHLVHGYDVTRSTIEFKPGKPLKEKRQFQIAADRGWQSTGVLVEQDHAYDLTASGQATLALVPRPWISEPQGVTIRYSEGRPIGELVACICSQTPLTEPPFTTMLTVYAVGRSLRLRAPVTGTLYLRVNDFWNELEDNAGSYSATIETAPR